MQPQQQDLVQIDAHRKRQNGGASPADPGQLQVLNVEMVPDVGHNSVEVREEETDPENAMNGFCSASFNDRGTAPPIEREQNP
eukprot:CAMPEP_0117602466 /NCGR_PEP_ID=MMETSP0784-20121206/77595_1 /TAXON_ID=39447 /ORGANISM="" /LENGTH=82 /DNA_ID=CAMNT_0005405285 /DNA_START=655 /DNA_END=904 /DNA_ORIENTATION=+